MKQIVLDFKAWPIIAQLFVLLAVIVIGIMAWVFKKWGPTVKGCDDCGECEKLGRCWKRNQNGDGA